MIDPQFYNLLAHLWRGGRYGYFWTDKDSEGEKYSYWVAIDPLNAPIVPKLFYSGNAYFSVNPSNIRRSEHERARVIDGDIVVANTFYCEYDDLTPEQKAERLAAMKEAQFKPACVIDSGGGLQCYYWLCDTQDLSTPEKQQRFADQQWAFAQWAGGDTSVNDLARVLRIPGTTNHKAKYAPNFPLVSIVDWQPQNQYELSELEPLLQPFIDKRDSAKAHTPHTPSSSTVSLSDQQLLDVLFASKNGDLYRRLWDGDDLGDHSVADQKLCNGLAWLTGRDTARMDSLFRQSGLYRDKWADRDDYRENTLNNAADSAQTVYTAPTIDPDAVKAANAAVGMNGNGAGYSGSQSSGGASAPQSQSRILLDFELSDQGNAETFAFVYPSEFVYTKSHGWLHYNGSYWDDSNAEAEIELAMVDVLRRRIQAALQLQPTTSDKLIRFCTPNVAKRDAGIKAAKSILSYKIDHFDNEPDLLNCLNGVVDLRTGQLISHDPSQLFTYIVPVEYDPSADSVVWVETLYKNTRVEDAEYLRLASGYSATGRTWEEILFYLFGPSRSGKGTFTETLGNTLGDKLSRELPFTTFTEKRSGDSQNFDLAPLKNCRMVFASEAAEHERLNEAKVKVLTGGNKVSCAFKHQNFFEYRPQYKIWLSANVEPNADPTDDAVWGRLRVIEFPNSHLGNEDKGLKEALRTPEVLRGVLRWIVSGAVDWYKLGTKGLAEPDSMRQYKSKRRNDLDVFREWLTECIRDKPGNQEMNSKVFMSYELWCKNNGVVPKKNKGFTQEMKRRGYNNQSTNVGMVWRDLEVK